MNPDYGVEFLNRVNSYTNTAEANDRVFAEFTAMTAADPLLAGHRRHVEEHKLGFGDPAFHALWRGLLAAASAQFDRVDALEIGVFKGQVISLWSLLAREHKWPVRVHAIAPLTGHPLPKWRWLTSLLFRINPHFRERVKTGNFHSEEDYETAIRSHFAHYELSFDDVRLVRGYSTDAEVQAAVADDQFHVVYIDGDHTFAGASADITHYAPKVKTGGWLVMDDAAFDLPGTTYWKGYESVARACRALPALGFENSINIGHNRVFRRRT